MSKFKIICILMILAIFTLLPAQQNDLATIETLYKNANLNKNNKILIINLSDNQETQSAKMYYAALLDNNIQNSILLHSENFSNNTRQLYGQLSGLQLAIIDYINKEYSKALNKLEKINYNDIPDALYWKIKITQLLQNHHEATNLSLSFIKKFPNHNKIPNIWLIVLESAYYNHNLTAFEKYLNDFAQSTEFINYKAYLLIYQGMLYEMINTKASITTAIDIYQTIINNFPQSQYRIQAEDRLFALNKPGSTTNNTTTPIPPISQISAFNNKIVSKYEQLDKNNYYLQFGVFSTQKSANNYKNILDKANIPCFVINKPVSGKTMYAVIQGPFNQKPDALNQQNTYDCKKYKSFLFFVN
ncbi:MAG: SPOR domain-containing protein [Candidatus Cloacimonetes bacterium]|nr:SPOR domain-containing protein [Candidatus Cloacimonadota bacterium]